MRNLSFILFIVTATIFASCNSSAEIEPKEENSFKYSEEVTIFTDDGLSNAVIQLSSDDFDFIQETAKNIHIEVGDFEISDNDVSEAVKGIAENTPVNRKIGKVIEIELVKLNSSFSSVEITILNNESILKSTVPHEEEYRHSVVEKNYDCTLKYKYITNDNIGIIIVPCHKESLLSGWGDRWDINTHWYGASDNGNAYVSPYNGNSPTYKHGFLVTTNENELENYSFIATAR